MVRIKITGLGVNFHYPLGPKGPAHELRRYFVEADDGRVDTIEEWDEPQTPDGVYEFSDEAASAIFDRTVEIDEGEW